MNPPEVQLLDYFKKEDINSVYFRKKVNFCYLANLCLHGYGIKMFKKFGKEFYEKEEVKLVFGKGDKEGFVFEKGGEKPEINPDKRPIILIDLGWEKLLKESERNSLKRQIFFAIKEARTIYWETVLYVVNEKFENLRILEFIPSRTILLDPYGEKELEKVDPRKSYLILGIVDRGNRLKGISSKIAEEYDLKTARISLKGKLLGVPYTIDRIVRILLLMLRGIEKEDAILLSCPKRWLKRRLESELNKKNKDIELIEKIKNILSTDTEEKILKMF